MLPMLFAVRFCVVFYTRHMGGGCSCCPWSILIADPSSACLLCFLKTDLRGGLKKDVCVLRGLNQGFLLLHSATNHGPDSRNALFPTCVDWPICGASPQLRTVKHVCQAMPWLVESPIRQFRGHTPQDLRRTFGSWLWKPRIGKNPD